MTRKAKRRILLTTGIILAVLVVSYGLPRLLAWRKHTARLERYPEVAPPANTVLTSEGAMGNFFRVPLAELFDKGFVPSGPPRFNLGDVDYSFIWFVAKVRSDPNAAMDEFERRILESRWDKAEAVCHGREDEAAVRELGSSRAARQGVFFAPGGCAIEGMTLWAQIDKRQDGDYLLVFARRWNRTPG